MAMAGDERGKPAGGPCGAPEGGYTIVLEEARVASFFEAGDFSSASELDHFKDIGAHVEKRIAERRGSSFVAVSAGEKSISRDFAVLQTAHYLAKHGHNVLIVDCDFLHPGMSGLIENVEEHGFLDLLLYGSSLRTVSRSVGIDGVSITGPGSFPVSRTIPFALKEFERIRDFLRTKSDAVIYCSTLYTEDGKINPLGAFLDGAILCCRIEEMEEGELQRSLADLRAAGAQSVEVVCFCAARDQAAAAARATAASKAQAPVEEPAIAGPSPERRRGGAPVIERASELEPLPERKKQRFSVWRLIAAGAAALIVVFAVWFVVSQRTMREEAPVPTKQGAAEQTQVPESTRTGAAPESAAAAPGTAPSMAAETAGVEAPQTGARQAARPGGAPSTAPSMPSQARVPITPIGAGAKYTIHVASFTNPARAETEKRYLEDNGYPVEIVEVDINGVKWLRVLAGSYATQAEADEARLQLLSLKEIGYARVVTIANEGR
jgi:cell division septation protein DedD/Mrp family chromosome partitioning ATPase